MIDIPCSYGELVDKITILRIKNEKITDASKLTNIVNELTILESKLNELTRSLGENRPGDLNKLNQHFHCLKMVNLKLWDIEDSIRDCELNKNFGDSFIELARAVYMTNDERSHIKRLINMLLGSKIIEEKSYKEYQ